MNKPPNNLNEDNEKDNSWENSLNQTNFIQDLDSIEVKTKNHLSSRTILGIKPSSAT
ncbi:MAG: hypothetical protein K0R26_2015 [Bacteroidota bacterium]|jgi:hypothetical protein|nr:hypothetical protein [Bacteroidota bacterium]